MGHLPYKIFHQIVIWVPLFLKHKNGYLGSLRPFLGWRFHLVRLWRVETSKAGLLIPSCHFTILLQSWCIDFLGFNNIGLAEQFCRLAQPRFRVDLFRFLSVPRSLKRVGKRRRQVRDKRCGGTVERSPFLFGNSYISEIKK